VGPPDPLLRIALGEVATVVATGQRVLPSKPLSLGYSFRYPELAGALREIFARKPRTVEAPPSHSHAKAGAGAHH
jgi:uncharacterized protein